MTVNVTESQVLDTGAGARDRTGMDLMGPRDFKFVSYPETIWHYRW